MPVFDCVLVAMVIADPSVAAWTGPTPPAPIPVSSIAPSSLTHVIPFRLLSEYRPPGHLYIAYGPRGGLDPDADLRAVIAFGVGTSESSAET